MSHDTQDDPVVRIKAANGLALIPKPTALTRLHYFDGKFLRADDLRAEQSYVRALVERSNQAGGWGVVHGFHTQRGGGANLRLHPGLAIDPKGRVLSLPGSEDLSISIEELIATTRPEAAAPAGPSGGAPDFGPCEIPAADGYVDPLQPSDLYLIVICHVEAACGIEEQYGQLCVDACATETDYRFLVEGVEVRALPLGDLVIPKPAGWPAGSLNLRSRVASAWFAAEPEQVSLISGSGLTDPAWCFGAEPGARSCVPLGVLGYAGGVIRFFDPWIARRERMEGPPRRYWAWRMRMRPWSVFLAQVLQFQCHLVDVLGFGPVAGGEDPCAEGHQLLDEAAAAIDDLRRRYEALLARAEDRAAGAGVLDEIEGLMGRVRAVQAARGDALVDHTLLKRGILELPAAGYLPVDPQREDTVNAQVRALLGDGVDLRFCVVRPDFVAHALEEAQHLDRISLTQGLADAEATPAVDILVPDGLILEAAGAEGSGWRAKGTYRQSFPPAGEPPYAPQGNALDAWAHGMVVNPGDGPVVELGGVGRTRVHREGGASAHLAGGGEYTFPVREYNPATGEEEGLRFVRAEVAGFVGMRIARSPFAMAVGQTTDVDLRALAAVREDEGQVVQVSLTGRFTVSARDGAEHAAGRLRLQGGRFERGGADQALDAQFDVELRFRLLGDGGSFVMEADSERSGRMFSSVNWRGTPTEVQALFAWLDLAFVGGDARAIRAAAMRAIREGLDAEAAIEARRRETPFVVDARLTRDVRVERADDPDRQRAERAIEIIAEELRDLDFQAEASALLFPPGATEGGLVVKATRDWVLFHRRRDKICALQPPAPPTPPVSPVRYEILVVDDADSGRGFELAILEALRGRPVEGDPLGGVRRIGAVEFIAGRSALWSEPSALQALWSAADPGPEASMVVIGGADLLPALARGRLDQITGALSVASDVLPQPTDFSDARRQILDGSGPRYPAVGFDGFVLVVVTPMAAVVTECHDVWRVDDPKVGAGILRDLSAIELIRQYRAVRLGRVRFNVADATPLDDPRALPGAPDHVSEAGVVYQGPGPADAPEVQGMARLRANAIARAIDPRFDGGLALGGIIYRPEEPAPDGCQAHTFLFVRPLLHRVAVHLIGAGEIDRARGVLEANPNGDPNILRTPQAGVPLIYEDLVFVAGNMDDLNAFIQGMSRGEILWSTLTPQGPIAMDEREAMADLLVEQFEAVGTPLPRPDEEIALPAGSDLWGLGGDFVLLLGVELNL